MQEALNKTMGPLSSILNKIDAIKKNNGESHLDLVLDLSPRHASVHRKSVHLCGSDKRADKVFPKAGSSFVHGYGQCQESIKDASGIW